MPFDSGDDEHTYDPNQPTIFNEMGIEQFRIEFAVLFHLNNDLERNRILKDPVEIEALESNLETLFSRMDRNRSEYKEKLTKHVNYITHRKLLFMKAYLEGNDIQKCFEITTAKKQKTPT